MTKKKNTGSYKYNAIARDNEAKTVRKIVAIIVILLILILTVGGVAGYTYLKSALNPVDPSNTEEIEVTIPMGSSTSTIANILKDEGIIKDARVFRFYIKFKNKSDFQAGKYTFSKAFTLDEIIESLRSGRVYAEPVYTITIPEGKTIEQIADIYANKLPFNVEEFNEKVNDIEYVEQLIEKYPTILSDVILDPKIKTPLEGYLFPATYEFFEEDPKMEGIVEAMLDKTVEVIGPYRDEISSMDFTMHQAITFASLLENEEREAEQRKKIAGVFYNRLEEGMMLQTDPTVAYAQGKHLRDVLLKDLEIESPYNTYKIPTLPIGPISNFAANAIEATVFPEETDYIYFLHDEEGNIHYSKTHDEHVNLKQKYRD